MTVFLGERDELTVTAHKNDWEACIWIKAGEAVTVHLPGYNTVAAQGARELAAKLITAAEDVERHMATIRVPEPEPITAE